MSEYVYAQILLPTSALEIPAIQTAILNEEMDKIENVGNNITMLYCSETPDGEFSYLEAACEEHHVPYDRNNHGDYFTVPLIKYFRPGADPISFAALDDDPIIPLDQLVNYINHSNSPLTVKELYTHFHIPLDSVGDYPKGE